MSKLSGLLLLSILLFTGCGEIGKVKTIKLGHGLNVDHSVHKAMVFLGERLEEKSGGEMNIEIYPNQQLGNERQLLELLQIGSLGMTKVSAGVMENFAPNMKVFGLPFIFRNKEHAFKIMDGEIGRELLLQGEAYWLRGLTFYDAGSRSFYTKERPVHTPEDLSGLKIRVMESVTAMGMVRSLGGSPTPISWGELYTALQQGVVDGAENNPPSFYLSRHYEVCKYYSLDEHTTLPDVVLIGTHIWDRLTPQQQEWLQEAVDESAVYQRKLWDESEQEALEAVKKAGVEIITPDKSTFQKEVATLIDSYKEDPEIARLIERIQETE
ncbi:TRAP transporter substrate-binding protein [Fulvivirgaceae bacterium BMA12]|uniref:TRAP transporter substrate-binding protein n=1 Tax=Agaribacillus aureus TaxID=3051825 RepID=A0ABT8LJY0_9BACT|nr:TRAP transporter substrate-binding protein [Fulvivirgaceae bacterium BMA12]